MHARTLLLTLLLASVCTAAKCKFNYDEDGVALYTFDLSGLSKTDPYETPTVDDEYVAYLPCGIVDCPDQDADAPICQITDTSSLTSYVPLGYTSSVKSSYYDDELTNGGDVIPGLILKYQDADVMFDCAPDVKDGILTFDRKAGDTLVYRFQSKHSCPTPTEAMLKRTRGRAAMLVLFLFVWVFEGMLLGLSLVCMKKAIDEEGPNTLTSAESAKLRFSLDSVVRSPTYIVGVIAYFAAVVITMGVSLAESRIMFDLLLSARNQAVFSAIATVALGYPLLMKQRYEDRDRLTMIGAVVASVFLFVLSLLDAHAGVEPVVWEKYAVAMMFVYFVGAAGSAFALYYVPATDETQFYFKIRPLVYATTAAALSQASIILSVAIVAREVTGGILLYILLQLMVAIVVVGLLSYAFIRYDLLYVSVSFFFVSSVLGLLSMLVIAQVNGVTVLLAALGCFGLGTATTALYLSPRTGSGYSFIDDGPTVAEL